MEEPKLKQKGLLAFKGQYIYSGIIVFVLLFGLTYSLIFFIQNQKGVAGGLTTDLISVETVDDGNVSLTNLFPVSDEVGLNGISKTLTITNTSNTNINVKLGLTPDEDSTIPDSSMKYGVYLNNVLDNQNTLSNSEYLYEGVLLKGETITLDVYLWCDESYTGDSTSFSGTFKVDTSNFDMLGTEYVSRLVDKEKGLYAINNDGILYTDTGTIREYRYSGENPDNYVWFNCKDGTTSGSSNCELWRIVGSFNVKGNEYQNNYQRLKLVKEESLSSQTFGTSNDYSSSSLNTYLNETYYNSLNDTAKSMILNSVWNTGSTVLTNTPNASLESEQASGYTAKIGLLSASDFGYSTSTTNYSKALNDSDLYNNSWLKEESYYTISPVTSSTTNIIGNDGTSFTNLEVTVASGVKPSIYLSPTVSIKGGNGTEDKPYELALESENQYYDEIPVVSFVTYNLNGEEGIVPNKTPVYADNSSKITTEITSKTNSSFQGWSTTSDGEVEYAPGDSINTSIITNNKFTLYAVWSSNLATKITKTLPLTEADFDGTRYVYGQTVDNNYVWYSGKMWRIVALNSDGTVKLVTQDNMTMIAWSIDESIDYSTSQIRSWLNTEFLPTINESLIVDSNWDYTTYTSFPTEKDTENAISVSDKVGLLSIYDYMMTGGTDSSSTSKTYLNIGYYWWTSSPFVNQYVSSVYVSHYNGRVDTDPATNANGVRPSVNLKSDIILTGNGNGEIKTPYMLEGDVKVGKANELLSNRISGEYINFNDAKYRIVGVENGLTKIAMADYSVNYNTLSKYVNFGASTDEITFSTTYGIGKYLDDWYNATSESDTSGTYTGLYLSEMSKAMIATTTDGIRWYAGPDDGTSYDYTKALDGTAIEATIGLPRYGEMFSTQFGTGYSTSTNTWLMTKYSSSNVWYIYNDGSDGKYIPTNTNGVRPSMYLKSDVKITGGSGMPHDPYTISQ